MVLLSQEGRKNNMAKKILKVNSLNELKYSSKLDGYILGINKFSCLFEKTFSISEIKEFIYEHSSKDVFVSFNKMVYNDELSDYKKTLLEVDKLGVKAIIVSDVAALTYGLKTNVILDQFHLNNSYHTINHYVKNGVMGVVLTDDITKDEIEKIRQNTSCLLFKNVLCFSHLSTSARKLVTNYMNYFKVKHHSKSYKIKERNKDNYYRIVEDDFGTHILNNKVLYLMDFHLPVDYEIIDGYLMDKNVFKDVLTNFYDNDKMKDILTSKYELTTGFINHETIYKVRKDER